MDLPRDAVHKLHVLEQNGFEPSDTTIATALNKHPRKAVDRFRTKCFLNSALRRRAHEIKHHKEKQHHVKLSPEGKIIVTDRSNISDVGDLDKPVYRPK